MNVSNTKTMIVLLEALGINFRFDDDIDLIIILSSKFDLLRAVLNSSDEIQYIYRGTKEWQDLINIIGNYKQ